MFLKILFLSIALFLTACQANSSTPPAGPTLPNSAVTASPAAALEPASALQSTSMPAPQPPSPTPTPRPYGGTAVLGMVGRPDSLNPITDSNPALHELTPLLYDSLLRADPHTARLQSGLAERWEYTDAGQKLLFYLPPDLKWSDGSPMTTRAIADSLKASQHPALRAFSNITASDDTTLTLTFKAIDCSAVINLALLPLLPTSQITATVPVGSGPFSLEEWPANKRTLTLSRNPYHREPAPALDGFIVRFLRDDEVEIALSEGQFDVVGPLATAPPELAAPQFTDMVYPAPQVVYLAMNYDPKNGDPLPSQVREALHLAPDRETLLADALGGDGQLMAGSLLPGHWAANPNLPHPVFDPDTARNLLKRAGLRDTTGDGWLDQGGKRLELGIRLNGQNELYQELGWLLSSYYRDLDLFVRAESVPVDSVIDDLFTHDFNLAIFSWPLLPDPDQRLYWHSTENSEGMGLNFTSYHNPELDRLLEEAVAIPGCPVDERATIYADIQQILAEERPVDFLLTPNRHILVANRLHGVEPGPFAPLTWNAPGWRLQEE